MGRPLRIEYPGAFYHVTARGNEQKEIFKSQKDREKFLSYLESATERYRAVIHAYCLMNNHYHLLLETPSGNLSQIMKHINGAYTNYFNAKRKRAGHLFQGRYKAILVDADEYAKELSRYIHLNPVRAGIVKTPEAYPWSSYHHYCGQKVRPAWLRTDYILSYFGKKEAEAHKKYAVFVNDLLGKEYESPMREVVAATILGNSSFIEEIAAAHVEAQRADRDLPAARKLAGRPSLEAIVAAANTVLGEDKRLATKACIYCCHKYSGAKLKEIGALFGIGESGVTQASKRFAMKLEAEEKLKKMVAKIERAVSPKS